MLRCYFTVSEPNEYKNIHVYADKNFAVISSHAVPVFSLLVFTVGEAQKASSHTHAHKHTHTHTHTHKCFFLDDFKILAKKMKKQTLT